MLALADRLNSLVGLFAAGLAPDRREGPVRPAPRGDRRRPATASSTTWTLTCRRPSRRPPNCSRSRSARKCRPRCWTSSPGRLSVVLKESGQKYDVVDAVLAAQADDPAGARPRGETASGVGRHATIGPPSCRLLHAACGSRVTRSGTFKVDEEAFEEQRRAETLRRRSRRPRPPWQESRPHPDSRLREGRMQARKSGRA